MSANVILCVAVGLFAIGSLAWAVWLDREPARQRRRRMRELAASIVHARLQIRQLFRESERRMDRMTGRHDDFHFGSRDDW